MPLTTRYDSLKRLITLEWQLIYFNSDRKPFHFETIHLKRQQQKYQQQFKRNVWVCVSAKYIENKCVRATKRTVSCTGHTKKKNFFFIHRCRWNFKKCSNNLLSFRIRLKSVQFIALWFIQVKFMKDRCRQLYWTSMMPCHILQTALKYLLSATIQCNVCRRCGSHHSCAKYKINDTVSVISVLRLYSVWARGKQLQRRWNYSVSIETKHYLASALLWH